MKKDVIEIANKKLKELSKRYSGFINVIVDDWRGCRFIYDTVEVRNCKNKCQKCQLYLLLKEEKNDIFSAGLYRASSADKKIFGPQNFLNCKTLGQYRDCYVNFLIKKTKDRSEIESELKLINNLKILYTKDPGGVSETQFRRSIIEKTLKFVDKDKINIVKDLLD